MTSNNILKMTPEDFLHQVKILAQIPSLTETIAIRQVVRSAAEKLNIDISPQELQESADLFRNMHRLHSAEDTFTWLAQHHLSLDDFEEMIHGTLLYKKVSERLFAEKVEPYFYEHRLAYEQATLYEIVLEDDDLAAELYYAIQEEEISFSEAARQYIKDEQLRRVGGYRGSLSRKDLKPEISAAVFAATTPTLLKPILTAQGSHLIFVEEVIPAQLNDVLRIQIQTKLFMDWAKEKAQNFKIDFVPSQATELATKVS